MWLCGLVSCLDCSYAGPIDRNPSSSTPPPSSSRNAAAAPANQVNDKNAAAAVAKVVGRSKGSSAMALAKFLDEKVPFREKVSPKSLCCISIYIYIFFEFYAIENSQ